MIPAFDWVIDAISDTPRRVADTNHTRPGDPMPDLFARVAPDSDATRPATREEAVAYVAQWGLPAAVEVLDAVRRRDELLAEAMELVAVLAMAKDAPSMDAFIDNLRARIEMVRANLET